MTDELRDPAEHLETNPHLESVAAEQVLLSVEVADHECSLLSHETEDHGRRASDNVDVEVETG